MCAESAAQSVAERVLSLGENKRYAEAIASAIVSPPSLGRGAAKTAPETGGEKPAIDAAPAASFCGDLVARAEKQHRCGNWLVFREIIEGLRKGENRIHAAEFCQQHLSCPVCAARRASRLLEKSLPKVACVRQDNKCRGYLVTCTVDNSDDLLQTLKQLRDGLKRMNERRRGKRRSEFGGPMRRVLGGLGQIEVKRGERSRKWHPHYHGLWLVEGEYWDFGAFRRCWAECSGAKVANVQLLHSEKSVIGGAELGGDEWKQQLARDCCEAIKYCVKFDKFASEKTPADVWQVATQLRTKRLFASFGALRGIEPPESLLDEPIDWNHVEWVERWFKYSKGTYKESERKAFEQEGRLPSRSGDAWPEPRAPHSVNEWLNSI